MNMTIEDIAKLAISVCVNDSMKLSMMTQNECQH